jgi:aryl-alcohol dehydrogenase-like predicted oxidoreductase
LQRISLGNSKLKVSRLCFGTEPFTIPKGPKGEKSQGDSPPKRGGEILRDALEIGVNFWDTSDDYLSHPHVAEGLKLVERRDVVLTDKSNANSFEEGEEAVKNSLEALGTDYLDVMMLHYVPFKPRWRHGPTNQYYEARSLESRMGALKAFCEAKDSGIVNAVGLSTHSTQVLKKTLDFPEIEVVFTTLNKRGSLIEDGSLKEHLETIKLLYETGKGVYVGKVLDAGKLKYEADSSIRFALQYHSFIHALDIGMYSIEDVLKNIRIFEQVLGK